MSLTAYGMYWAYFRMSTMDIDYEGYKKIARRWIKSLVNAMDALLDEETKMRLVEPCGRACARGDGVPFAEQCRGDLDRFLAMMRRWHGGEEMIQRDGDTITILCASCLCPLVKDGAEDLRAPTATARSAG